MDLEDQIDAVLRELHDLRLDRRGEPAGPPIDLDDALDVRPNPGAGIDHPRTELHFLVQLVLLDRLVPLEGDPIDDRIFNDADDEDRALAANGHIGEEARRKQGLERLIDLVGLVFVANGDLHVGADGLRLDTLVSLDANLGNDVRISLSERSPFEGYVSRERGEKA